MDNLDIEKLKLYIDQLEESQTPLTKSKTTKKEIKSEIKPEITQEIVQEIKPIKEKKRWSEKKEEQFKIMQEKRKVQVENNKNKKKLENAKLLFNDYTNKLNETKKILPKTNKEIVENSDVSEAEIIHVRKEKKSKKKIKKIVIEESESETETESESEIEEKPKKNSRDFKSMRNKKSVITVHEKPKTIYNPNYNSNNFFV